MVKNQFVLGLADYHHRHEPILIWLARERSAPLDWRPLAGFVFEVDRRMQRLPPDHQTSALIRSNDLQ